MAAVPVRLAAFAAALLAVFALAFGVGRATGDDGGGADDVPADRHGGFGHSLGEEHD